MRLDKYLFDNGYFQSRTKAVEAIERGNYGQAKDILISAEQRCEAQYLEAQETPADQRLP